MPLSGSPGMNGCADTATQACTAGSAMAIWRRQSYRRPSGVFRPDSRASRNWRNTVSRPHRLEPEYQCYRDFWLNKPASPILPGPGACEYRPRRNRAAWRLRGIAEVVDLAEGTGTAMPSPGG